MTAEIKDSADSLDTARINIVEKSFEVKLPLQYREFLQKHNGGYPEPDGFLFKDESDGSSVDRFLGIDVGDHSNLEKYLVTYKNRIPKNLFPIAHDPGGNLVLIGLSGDELGKIYYWDHEREADGWEPDMSNVHLIANDLDEFLRKLYEIEVD